MTVAAENVIDSPTRSTAATTACLRVHSRAQVLAHPEDEEQAVVRARAEDQHDQQDLGQRRHLEPVLRGLGHERS